MTIRKQPPVSSPDSFHFSPVGGFSLEPRVCRPASDPQPRRFFSSRTRHRTVMVTGTLPPGDCGFSDVVIIFTVGFRLDPTAPLVPEVDFGPVEDTGFTEFCFDYSCWLVVTTPAG